MFACWHDSYCYGFSFLSSHNAHLGVQILHPSVASLHVCRLAPFLLSSLALRRIRTKHQNPFWLTKELARGAWKQVCRFSFALETKEQVMSIESGGMQHKIRFSDQFAAY